MKGKRVLKKQLNKNGLLSTYFASLFSVMLCFVMLLGTTFAWFYTGNTSLGNEIHSGTLKVDMLHNGTSLAEESEHAVFSSDVWSPSDHERSETVRIVNKGSVVLDYKLDFVPAPGELATGKAAALFTVSVDETVVETLDKFLSDTDDDTDDYLLAAGRGLLPDEYVDVRITLTMDKTGAAAGMGQKVPIYLKLEACQSLAAMSEQIEMEE